ncbi:Heptahelical transmembrane protein 2 [Hibiscus syriacus]|uniref:Heptahelical transmembrane protein 2 n=1 Tax=Hibiscus syriacus TaxID=106335 RepID=A0A6A2Z635_HIBSY|nr:Heptahelical transmembrane protein 2 [Hibiscus syriacus]
MAIMLYQNGLGLYSCPVQWAAWFAALFSHLFACHSRRYNLFFWRLDYAGISLMIVCSFFAPIYYAFFCHPYSCFFYLASISVLGVLAIITLLAPALSASRYRNFRACLFLAMGFSGVIPAAHEVSLHWGHPHIFVALGYEVVMAFLYSAGDPAGYRNGRSPVHSISQGTAIRSFMCLSSSPHLLIVLPPL